VENKNFILGAGMAGLAAGFASGLPVIEATEYPGGICSSYYLKPGDPQRQVHPPKNGEAYRFEIGGGHWIFGGDRPVLNLLKRFVDLKAYRRRSSIWLQSRQQYVPYPIQNHLRHLGRETAAQALSEMASGQGATRTMHEWLIKNFGPTLCGLFFTPFHQLYTAGLYDRIAPQDSYKSPVNISDAIQGALNAPPAVGYNVTFVYPEKGLSDLAQLLAADLNIKFGKRVKQIDLASKLMIFTDGTEQAYDKLLSSLPLNRTLRMSGLMSEDKEDPYSSVLVLNIGAVRGRRCPDDHWIYVPESAAGFHRVGFYSNVDVSFLPASARKKGSHVSIYVERAFPGGSRPSDSDIHRYAGAVVQELQDLDFIGETEVVDETWIDVAYTWFWPGSVWRHTAMETLEKNNIFPVGRYARWAFQGIAASLRDGLLLGASFKK